ncbi:MAG: hypothetical protein JOZ53_16980 [Planctomycetaceae bacterium]|nr:hypothetical protein [Planctomycetaceae bacterium]
MTLRWRTVVLAGLLALAADFGFGARPASAQNTYADFPFQQGSLFYNYYGNTYARRQQAARARAARRMTQASRPNPYNYQSYYGATPYYYNYQPYAPQPAMPGYYQR